MNILNTVVLMLLYKGSRKSVSHLHPCLYGHIHSACPVHRDSGVHREILQKLPLEERSHLHDFCR